MTYDKSRVRAFRVGYEAATEAGYVGTKREWARLLIDAPHLFAPDRDDEAREWWAYMERSARSSRRTLADPYIGGTGAVFRRDGRVT